MEFEETTFNGLKAIYLIGSSSLITTTRAKLMMKQCVVFLKDQLLSQFYSLVTQMIYNIHQKPYAQSRSLMIRTYFRHTKI